MVNFSYGDEDLEMKGLQEPVWTATGPDWWRVSIYPLLVILPETKSYFVVCVGMALTRPPDYRLHYPEY